MRIDVYSAIGEVRILQNWSRCFSINPRSTERETKRCASARKNNWYDLIHVARCIARATTVRAHSALKSSRPQPPLIGLLSSSLPSALSTIHRIPARTHPREPSRNTWIGFECPRFIAIDCGTVAARHDCRTVLFAAIIFCRRFRYSILSTSQIHPRYRDGKTRRCGRTL